MGKRLKKVRHRCPMRVGLTGSLASGKTTVLRLFKKQGFQTLSADDIVSKIYKQKGLSKKSLGKMSSQKLHALEKWIHPLVILKIKEAIKRSRKPLAIEIPLLFEKHLEKLFDATVFVTASKAERKRRALRRGMSASLFDFLDKQQWPARHKMRLADDVIRNE